MTKRVHIAKIPKGGVYGYKEILKVSPRFTCPVPTCGKTYVRRAAWSGHCEKHVRKGELDQYIENPFEEIQWQRFGYRLPEKDRSK